MDYIGISQSIGRVIRLGGAEKTFGLVCVPVFDKVGIGTAKSVQAVVDTVFQQGEPAFCCTSMINFNSFELKRFSNFSCQSEDILIII